MMTTINQLSQAPPQENAKQTKKTQKLPALTGIEEKLLIDMYHFDFLTVRQVQRLYYSVQSFSYVSEILTATVAKGYVQHHVLPRRTAGRTPGMFCLSAKGMKHLCSVGYPAQKRRDSSDIDSLSYLFWSHTLAVNDFLIAANLLGKFSSDYSLLQFKHDRELKKDPVFVAGDISGKQMGVVPDAWLDFRIQVISGNSRQLALVLELDRGTIPIKDMKRKMRGLLRYIDGPYQERFQTKSVTICFATTAGEGRLRLLRTWCQQVLEVAGRKNDGMFFYFTLLHPPSGDLNREIDPHTLFLTPVWYIPFDEQPKILLAT